LRPSSPTRPPRSSRPRSGRAASPRASVQPHAATTVAAPRTSTPERGCRGSGLAANPPERGHPPGPELRKESSGFLCCSLRGRGASRRKPPDLEPLFLPTDGSQFLWRLNPPSSLSQESRNQPRGLQDQSRTQDLSRELPDQFRRRGTRPKKKGAPPITRRAIRRTIMIRNI
jgi:hypothetical protein